MSTVYVDPSATDAGDGTLARPFKSWKSVAWAPGNTYLQKRGTTYAGVFKVSTSGAKSQRIIVGSYYGADGSDDPSRPKPIIILPARPTLPAQGASIAVHPLERDFITYQNLDIRNPDLPDESDVALIWLGNHCIFENNDLVSNCTGIYVFEKNHVTVANCVLDVVGCPAACSNCGILVAGNADINDIRIAGNTVYHRGGGSRSSHGIRCETYKSAARLTNLVIQGNSVSPPRGQAYSSNRGAIGIYLVNGRSAQLHRNMVTGMLTGIFVSSGEHNHVSDNHCSANMDFGIHITGFAKSFLIEGNICNNNGGTLSSNFYGRGIELSSAAIRGAVAGHIIQGNTCKFNHNYGGPDDNGSEGVGIGLDDGTTKCSVYGEPSRQQ